MVRQSKEAPVATYSIVRFFQDKNVDPRLIRTGLTLEQAQRWCRNAETSSSTCTKAEGKNLTKLFGPWFDGYSEERSTSSAPPPAGNQQ
jgi:hypothetical protein